MKTGVLLSGLLVLLNTVGNAQTLPSCDSVVKKVAFENTSGLSPKQKASLKKLLIGRCFQRESLEVLSAPVYEQLLAWGFKHVMVDDPHVARVLDESVKPSPVAVTIDFRLTGLDDPMK